MRRRGQTDKPYGFQQEEGIDEDAHQTTHPDIEILRRLVAHVAETQARDTR